MSKGNQAVWCQIKDVAHRGGTLQSVAPGWDGQFGHPGSSRTRWSIVVQKNGWARSSPMRLLYHMKMKISWRSLN